ncbi:MAG TPA: ABC transporter substrate-binding protein [Thermoanaerobaculia bacterium]|nr:ABC transporter substrate-binding protein [Thermoanaerobaculia bacterium]
MKSTRDSSVCFLLGLSLVLPAACRRPAAPPRDTLVVALESSPINFDPRVGTDTASWRVHDVLYNALLRKGAGGEYLPDLAEGCSSDDAVVWRCRLRDGVLFHDGRLLTSADVAFTYRSVLAPGLVTSKREPLRVIREIATPSPRDVEFRLTEPYALFPLQLLLGILPDGTSPEQAAERPVGTGPFRFVRTLPDDRLDFDRFERHFAGAAKVARLVYRIVPDATTRALELLRGSLDLSVNNLPADLLPRFQNDPALAVTIGPGTTYAYLAFNLRDPVLEKKEVRRALALALDRDALAEGLFRGTVETTETLVPPGHWARDDGLPPLARDLDRARALLEAAGFPDPGGGRPRLSLTYKTSTDEVGILQATAIAEQWKAIGVTTTIRSNDFATFYQDVVRGNFQLYALRWQGIVDADHYHEVFLSTAVPPKGWNRGFFADSDVDRWIQDARHVVDRSLRRDLYLKIQRRVADELPYVSLYTMKTVAVHAKGLTGVGSIHPSGDFTFLKNVGWK